MRRELITIWIEKSSVLRKLWKPSVIACCSSVDFNPKLIDEQISTPRYDPSFRIMTPFRISLTGTNCWVALEEVTAILFSCLDIERPRKLGELPAGKLRCTAHRGHIDHRHLLGGCGVLVLPEEELCARVVA